MISPSPGCLQSSVCSSTPYIHRLRAVSLFSWSSKMQMTEHVTEGVRRERHKTRETTRKARENGLSLSGDFLARKLKC